jgi:hypothetical protein
MTTVRNADPVARLYHATTTPELVEVPALWFLSADGHGDPNTAPEYAEAVQSLFAVSYAAKFAVKKTGGADFKVSPLEGLWTAADLGAFLTGDKADWDWTMMIRQPDSVSAELVDRLAEEVAIRKGLALARRLRFERFEEGPAAQVLHVGPYATEGPTIARLHAYLHEHGFAFDGHVHRHHEIYLGDPRRAAPEKLRTIIRQAYAAP